MQIGGKTAHSPPPPPRRFILSTNRFLNDTSHSSLFEITDVETGVWILFCAFLIDASERFSRSGMTDMQSDLKIARL